MAQASYRKERLTGGLDDFKYATGEEIYLGACRLQIWNSCFLIAGSEVVLIYWPPTLTSRDVCAANGYGTAVTIPSQTGTQPHIVSTSAITFHRTGVADIARAFEATLTL